MRKKKEKEKGKISSVFGFLIKTHKVVVMESLFSFLDFFY